MRLLDRYTRPNYSSFEDFCQNYILNVPDNFNFAFDVMDVMASIAPNQRAMIWTNTLGDEHIFTFGDFEKLSNKAANVLKKIGIKQGDPVLLMLKRRYEYWVIALALMKLGCIQIPATHQLQKKDIMYRNDAASIKAIICVNEPTVINHVQAALSESPTAIIAAAINGNAPNEWVDFDEEFANASDIYEREVITKNDDIMLMYFTSGTTGMPKMVAQDFTYPLGHIITGRFWHNLDETSIHLTVADSGWAKCGWGKFYGQWLTGATLMVYDFDKFDAHDMLEIIQKYKLTSFCAPPTIFRFLIKEDLSSYDLSSLKWGTVAGEPLNPEVYQQFLAMTGVALHEGFGQSETTPILLTPVWLEPRPGSMGKPSPHYHVALLNEDGKEVEIGEEGEICIDMGYTRPAGLFLGYYRDRERTEDAFRGGYYHTGDMAWCDEDGYFWFIGRADDVIKSSGYRIGPFEVESALIEHPSVLECAITGVPHPDRGQVVKATVVLAKGYTPSDALKKQLQEHVKKVTAPYKYPRIIEFVEDLPKTISGKIQRVKIRKEDMNV